jgi:hypothetical protein
VHLPVLYPQQQHTQPGSSTSALGTSHRVAQLRGWAAEGINAFDDLKVLEGTGEIL